MNTGIMMALGYINCQYQQNKREIGTDKPEVLYA